MNNRNEETDNNRQSIKLERELTEIERIVKELKSRYNELHKEYERRGRDPEYFNGIALELECLTCDIHGYTLQYNICKGLTWSTYILLPDSLLLIIKGESMVEHHIGPSQMHVTLVPV